MNPFLFLLLFLSMFSTQLLAKDGKFMLPDPRFSPGNNETFWKNRDFDDSKWNTINAQIHWELQGYEKLDGYAWYRFTFVLPSSLRDETLSRDAFKVCLGYIDDVDETFWNGEMIGKTGRFPYQGYQSAFQVMREYVVDANAPFVKWDEKNVLVVRVLDEDKLGGINGIAPFIQMLDSVEIDAPSADADVSMGGTIKTTVKVKNLSDSTIKGNLIVSSIDRITKKEFSTQKKYVTLNKKSETKVELELNHEFGLMLEASYSFETEDGKKTGSYTGILPYILTPKAPLEPRINGADIFGVRPNSPFLFKIAATGEKPLTYDVKDLPDGLTVDKATGIISGKLSKEGDYRVTFIVKNKQGTAEQFFDIKCGNLLALTPPMGWNSWNCFGRHVTEGKVKTAAETLIEKGLIDYGWTYVNIDDGWQAPDRDENGILQVNEKFGSIKELSDWMHAHGLKIGIYSSPGPFTCEAFIGSYQHEALDAKIYADWGIDYLKYDWCGYRYVNEDDSLEGHKRPYALMYRELSKQPRDIVYSLCQYGMRDVWTWGAEVGGNSWRISGDIVDVWSSMSSIAFRHGVERMVPYSAPGHWNDLDMLVLGKVGWNDNLRTTRLNWDEQYTHVTFWAIQACPLLIGCDMGQLDDFTLGLLINNEVIAINQDRLGEGAMQMFKSEDYEIWVKNLHNGDKAVGVFNLSNSFKEIPVSPKGIGVKTNSSIRDVWRQTDIGSIDENTHVTVPPHGSVLIRVTK